MGLFGSESLEEALVPVEQENARLRELVRDLEDALKRERVRRKHVEACNEAMREPMNKLRALVGMWAEGEGAVVDVVARELARHYAESYAHPLPIVGCLCGACDYERRKQRELRIDPGEPHQ